MPGGYAERFNAWADKAFTGKLSPQVAQEGQQLMDDILNSAHMRSVQAAQIAAQGHQIPAAQMPAMDHQGNVTTLDKVVPPPGAVMRVPMKNSGQYHWFDANKKDLGVSP